MATSVLIQEELEIPFTRSLEDFRAWARSDEFPKKGRIDYVAGRIEVDMSPEDLYTHGNLKTKLVSAIDQVASLSDLGDVFSDATRVSSRNADLSAEPDAVFVSYRSLETGKVRLVPKASGEPGRFVELEGAPDLIAEIVSDDSVAKDTKRLPAAYWRAGVAEFWLADARGADFLFQIYCRGPEGWLPVPRDADGFQVSVVFGCSFRVTRRRGRLGHWTYNVDRRP